MPPMLIGAGIAAAGSIGGALIGSSAAKKAAKAQTQSAEAGIAEQRRQYDQTRQDFTPYREAGSAAIGSLSDMLKPGYDYTTSPGYQFRMDEGNRAIEGSAAARGLLHSGGAVKDMLRFSQGLAADDFQQSFNRTASVAQGGQQVASTLGGLGANSANGISSLLTQAGNARASGYVGSANAITGGMNNLASIFANMGGGGMNFGGF